MLETIKVGKKDFKVLEELSDNSFKVERKNKTFFLKQFAGKFNDYETFVENRKRFQNNGIKVPKTILKDKKSLSVVTEFISGDNVLDLLIKGPLSEDVFKQIFKMTYLARIDKVILDFDPENYIFSNDTLYYLGLKYDKYLEQFSFVQKGIRLWFYTKDFSNLLVKKNLPIDKNRLKEDYVVNKEIVLMTIKYYY